MRASTQGGLQSHRPALFSDLVHQFLQCSGTCSEGASLVHVLPCIDMQSSLSFESFSVTILLFGPSCHYRVTSYSGFFCKERAENFKKRVGWLASRSYSYTMIFLVILVQPPVHIASDQLCNEEVFKLSSGFCPGHPILLGTWSLWWLPCSASGSLKTFADLSRQMGWS